MPAKLPPISDAAAAPDLTNKRYASADPGAKGLASKSKLFDTGLKSTSLMVDRVKESVYKPPRVSSLVAAAKEEAQSYMAIEEETNQKLGALERQASHLRRSGEEVELASEERQRAQYDGIHDDVAALKITPEGQQVLADGTRSFLSQHKNFE